MGQTVNLLAYAFGGSNPSLPTKAMIEYNSFIAFVFYPRRRENPRYAEGEMKAHSNHPKPTVLYVPQYVANFVSKKSCSI